MCDRYPTQTRPGTASVLDSQCRGVGGNDFHNPRTHPVTERKPENQEEPLPVVPEKKAGEEKHSGVTVGEGRREGGEPAAGARLAHSDLLQQVTKKKKKMESFM